MAHSSIAADREGPSDASTARPPPVLVLASEALREDMAPLEPDRRVGRWVLGGVAVALGLLGIAMRYGVGDPKTGTTPASFTLAAAGAAGALAGLPFSYLVRATAILALGTALMLLGAAASGPLAGLRIGSSLPPELARLLALAVLPGALLFRARYRAYPKARVVLGLALIAAAPFAVSRGFVFASPRPSPAEEATAAADVAVILSGFFGFMGADTTGGGSVGASLWLGGLSSDIAVRRPGTD